MKAFLDTSVLVPAFYGDHPHHTASLNLFARLNKDDGSCGAHSLVEVYATLTQMPGRHRVNAEQSMLFLGDMRKRLTIVALDSREYEAMLERFSAVGILGGAIYDALLASCALKSKARSLYSWNLRHYEQFGTEITRILKTP